MTTHLTTRACDRAAPVSPARPSLFATLIAAPVNTCSGARLRRCCEMQSFRASPHGLLSICSRSRVGLAADITALAEILPAALCGGLTLQQVGAASGGASPRGAPGGNAMRARGPRRGRSPWGGCAWRGRRLHGRAQRHASAGRGQCPGAGAPRRSAPPPRAHGGDQPRVQPLLPTARLSGRCRISPTPHRLPSFPVTLSDPDPCAESGALHAPSAMPIRAD